MANAKFFEAKLIERVDFSEDLGLFRFSTDGLFNFEPGQYATIGIEKNGKLIQRPYSIVSSPYEPFLEFFVEVVEGGALTPLIWNLKIGDNVVIRKRIVGKFTLDKESGIKHHLMVATVTGAAPYISMARAQRTELERGKLSEPHQFLIIHGASRSWELGVYKEELTEMERDGWLIYIPTVSRPWEDTEWKGETGRAEDVLRKYSHEFDFDHTNSVGYACGHPQMIENAKGILARARFPEEQIREEKFFVIKE